MRPGMGPRSFRPRPPVHKDLPFNGLLYIELQVVSLYGHKHEANDAVTQCIGRHFNQTSTSLSMLLHLYRMYINMARVHQLTTP